MMRLSFVAICLVAILCSNPTNAVAADNPLVREMAVFAYLLDGQWTCTSKVPYVTGKPAHIERYIVAFEIAPGNTVHERRSSDYSFDRYLGYDPKTKAYWMTRADNMGFAELLTSNDGVTYNGTAWGPGLSYAIERTYSRVSANELTIHDVFSPDRGLKAIETTCVRQESTP